MGPTGMNVIEVNMYSKYYCMVMKKGLLQDITK